ncbi:MAG: dephospho-CoA kinase [Vicinamibacterales bacterium]
MAAPARIGLTGGIGTGKSFVLRHLARCGVPTLDTDDVSRDVVRPGTPAFAAVVARFGPAVLEAGGALNRAELARVVFADAAARRDLEAIVHPAVWQAVDTWFAGQPATGVVAVPLLFETGAEARFDRVLLTDCPVETQVARVMARDGLAADAVRARVLAQMPAPERRRRADAVVDTSGTPDETIGNLAAVWRAWGLPALVPADR